MSDSIAATLRTWTEHDPEPSLDVRAVVDPDGITWARCSCNLDFPDDPPSRYWHQHLLTIRGGVVLGGSIENDWRDLFDSLPKGSVVREATGEERRTWIQRREPVEAAGA